MRQLEDFSLYKSSSTGLKRFRFLSSFAIYGKLLKVWRPEINVFTRRIYPSVIYKLS